ncbi:IS701 family transposase [Streptomyces sp. NPDC018693]|uniref:IS701 family transposase n=1 Tax=unclassified Streptomyces TaxID=2593676 RepID=UPI0037AC7C30
MSRFQFVADHRDAYGVKRLCEVLGLHRSSYYKWFSGQKARSSRQSEDRLLAERIREVHGESGGAYGSPRVTAELRAKGLRINEKRVARIMRTFSITGIRLRRRVRTTVPDPAASQVPDLFQRDFTATEPGRKYMGDITYLPLAGGEFLYLATVLDCFSRKVVGWSIADHMRTGLVADARLSSRSPRDQRSVSTITGKGPYAQAKIPDACAFATKGDLAKAIIMRALASPLPIAWVTADSAYGQEWWLRRMLEETGVGYVLAVPKSQHVHAVGRIDFAIAQAPEDAWERHSCGAGVKGPRVYEWAAARLPAIDDFDGDEPTHDRWVLARRSLARPDEIAYYLAYAPAGTPVAELVWIAGARWAIEEAFQAAKNECGLDQYEVRRHPGWYRHITLAMLAHAFLAAMAAAAGTERGGRNGSDALAPLTVAEIRRLLATGHPTPTHLRHTGHALNWSRWRRRHEATARRCHYHRRTQGHELPPPDEASAEYTPKQGSDQQR